MDMREDIFYQFFQELIESYRHDILQREDVKELAQKEIGLWNQIRGVLFPPVPSADVMVWATSTGPVYRVSGP